LEISRDAMGFSGSGGALNHGGKVGQLLDQIGFLGLGEDAEISPRGAHARWLAPSDAEDPEHARVRHLDVEHRVLVRLTLGEIDVEDKVRLTTPHQIEVAHRVPSDLFHEIADRHIAARDLVEEVGRDAVRYFYLMRRGETHFVFDVDLAKSQTDENPVFYVQMAHARMVGIFRVAGRDPASARAEGVDLSVLTQPEEADLIKE